MRRLNRFSTISVYGVTAVLIALLYRWGNLSVAIVGALAVVIWLLVELLSRNLPKSIRSAQTANCRRRNGTWSIARERAEARAVGKLKGELLLAVIVVVLPTIAVVWFIDSEVIPISMGIDAMSVFEMPLPAWQKKSGARPERIYFFAQKQRTLGGVDIQQNKEPVGILDIRDSGWIGLDGVGVFIHQDCIFPCAYGSVRFDSVSPIPKSYARPQSRCRLTQRKRFLRTNSRQAG